MNSPAAGLSGRRSPLIARRPGFARRAAGAATPGGAALLRAHRIAVVIVGRPGAFGLGARSAIAGSRTGRRIAGTGTRRPFVAWRRAAGIGSGAVISWPRAI